MTDAEVYDEFTDEQIENPDGFVERVYNLGLDEFQDYENKDGPIQEVGWTVRKRRRIRERLSLSMIVIWCIALWQQVANAFTM